MRVARLYDMEQLRALVAPVAKDFGVRSVYAFGSYGRGQANGESDLDLRIEAGGIRSLFALADDRRAAAPSAFVRFTVLNMSFPPGALRPAAIAAPNGLPFRVSVLAFVP